MRIIIESVEQWRAERTVSTGKARSAVLYRDYAAWVSLRKPGWKQVPFPAVFGYALRSLGVECVYTSRQPGKPTYHGISLK